jgi:hypothetical protein
LNRGSPLGPETRLPPPVLDGGRTAPPPAEVEGTAPAGAAGLIDPPAGAMPDRGGVPDGLGTADATADPADLGLLGSGLVGVALDMINLEKSQISNISNLKFQISNFKFQISNLKYLKSQISNRKIKFANLKSEPAECSAPV